MGMSSGTRVTSKEFRVIPRTTCLTIVTPCGERISLTPDEARKLTRRVNKAAKESGQKLAQVTFSEAILT